MKKLLVLCALCGAIVMLSGCVSHYVNNYGFGSTLPGILYSNQKRGTFMLPKMQSMKDVEVLGKVCGKSTERNILMLIALGDGGIEAAKNDALKSYPQADDIVNIEVDTQHDNILPIYNESTTILRGIAIKYKK